MPQQPIPGNGFLGNIHIVCYEKKQMCDPIYSLSTRFKSGCLLIYVKRKMNYVEECSIVGMHILGKLAGFDCIDKGPEAVLDG